MTTTTRCGIYLLCLALTGWLALPVMALDEKNDPMQRGLDAFDKNDLAAAIAAFTEVIKQDPKNKDAYVDRGNTYAANGNFDKALADFNKVIDLDPAFTDAYYNRGVTYAAKGDFAKAIADYRTTIKMDINYVDAYVRLAWVLATCTQANLRNGQDAVENAMKAYVLSTGKSPQAIDALAAASAETGNFDNATKWEIKYIGTPGLNKNEVSAAESRLALYQLHKPYHESK